MSHTVSRRQFLHGMGIVAAAAALSACSSTNQAISDAIIDGTVGGIVVSSCKISNSKMKKQNSEAYTYYVKASVTLNNVGSKIMKISPDNFSTALDGAPVSPAFFGYVDGEDTWRTCDLLLVKPGEEQTFILEYEVSNPLYEDWYKHDHTAAVTFTCGGQRITYTGTSRSSDVAVGQIENV